jgi:hypothetical protein
MKRTFSVLSLLILAACGGSEKRQPAAAAGATPTLTQPEKEARYAEFKKRQAADTTASVQAAEKRKADEAQLEEEKKAVFEAAYAKTPGGKVWEKHRDWSRATCDMIAKRHIVIGMTAEQVRAAWGKPYKINSTMFRNSTHEQWVIHEGDSTYVYFENGIMTSLQQSN